MDIGELKKENIILKFKLKERSVSMPSLGTVSHPLVMNPQAGSVMNYQAGTVMNPQAGSVMNPQSGSVMNPQAGSVMNPQAGTVHHPAMNLQKHIRPLAPCLPVPAPLHPPGPRPEAPRLIFKKTNKSIHPSNVLSHLEPKMDMSEIGEWDKSTVSVSEKEDWQEKEWGNESLEEMKKNENLEEKKKNKPSKAHKMKLNPIIGPFQIDEDKLKEDYKDTPEHIEIIKNFPRLEYEIFNPVKDRIPGNKKVKILNLLFNSNNAEETIAEYQLTRKMYENKQAKIQ